MKNKIAVVVGSLRKDSLNLKMAKALIAMQPDNLEMEIVGIGNLPLYNQDFDEDPPREWSDFRKKIQAAKGVLFVTPEYNRSVPAPLKNAIDVGSRPYGQSSWNAKVAAIVSVSPGAIGGFGANHHLRQSLVFLNMPTLQQPEAYIGGADKLFDQNGDFTNASTKEFFSKYLSAFSDLVTLHTHVNR